MDKLVFDKAKLDNKLSSIKGLTLGEVDVNHIFDRTLDNPKITGIAGDVIEQSVLDYPANSRQSPDIIVVDNGIEVETEVKTTGIRKSKFQEYEAKEPMSITAVSIPTIGKEEFETSKFWHKVAHMLIVYYEYDSANTIEASGYSEFHILGHDFHDTDKSDKEMLRKDWERVRQFITDIQENSPNPEAEYPRLSSALRNELLLIDTSPKYPHPPRFRFKRNYVTTLFNSYLNGSNERLPHRICGYSDISSRCAEYRKLYGGMTIGKLASLFGLQNVTSKSVCESVVVAMFGGKSKRINQIDDFVKIGIIGKTIILNPEGGRTEDMKMLPIDFDEIRSNEINFDGTGNQMSSTAYDFFREHSFLCAVFEEPEKNALLADIVFRGFKRMFFDDAFIEKDLSDTWNAVRSLVVLRELKEDVVLRKDGSPIINDTGIHKTTLNFPKKGKEGSSLHNNVFVRGSGRDSSRKPETVNGIGMYQQWFWLDGRYVVSQLDREQYL